MKLKVADFGLASLTSSINLQKLACGTLKYMAP